ncbi:MAG: hypothetical protein HPY61_11025 [Methanotrichaceae archaeon]|nr:hypothetical protein [Methanotrichaceae archaeon]
MGSANTTVRMAGQIRMEAAYYSGLNDWPHAPDASTDPQRDSRARAMDHG